MPVVCRRLRRQRGDEEDVVSTAPPAESPLSAAMALLASGVPLSLLLDLVAPVPSEELLWWEGRGELPAPRPSA